MKLVLVMILMSLGAVANAQTKDSNKCIWDDSQQKLVPEGCDKGQSVSVEIYDDSGRIIGKSATGNTVIIRRADGTAVLAN